MDSFLGHQYRLYLAAVYTNRYMPGQRLFDDLNEREKSAVSVLPNILESYHYVGRQQYVDEMRANEAGIFLDSGAFSAYTLGVNLRVEDYVAYILRNRDIIRVEDGVLMASVLDGIGDPLQTWRNQTAMENMGARPLPCFHAGEPEEYLEHYVKNYEYITLGGMVGTSTKQLCIWLDRIWDRYLTDGSGRARIKVHGFGITARPVMQRYPWHSCDSSSWIQSASFGAIENPKHGPINVSDKSPSRHERGQHVTTLTAIEQDYVLRQLEEQGFTYERLSTVYQSRAAYNLWAYTVINANINAIKAKGNGTFGAEVMELF
jgi:hypothetical protein